MRVSPVGGLAGDGGEDVGHLRPGGPRDARMERLERDRLMADRTAIARGSASAISAKLMIRGRVTL
jgi:hypothetical protein